MNHRTLAIVVASLLALAAPVPAQNLSKDQPALHFDFDADAIKALILQNTDESIARAMAEIRRNIARPHPQGVYATIAARWGWSVELEKVKRYPECLEVCRLGVNRVLHERPVTTGGLQRRRVMVLLALGRNEEALAHAKLYFNICVTAETADAIKVLMQCLQAAHPGDPSILERFRQEQVAGAVLTTEPPSPDAVARSVLGSIELPAEDAAEFERIVRLSADARPNDVMPATTLGNALLMLGRSAEARRVFERTFTAHIPDRAAADALENVARAIRAEDGTIGRANAFLLQHQPR